jgi:hypothetical protein
MTKRRKRSAYWSARSDCQLCGGSGFATAERTNADGFKDRVVTGRCGCAKLIRPVKSKVKTVWRDGKAAAFGSE